METEMNREETIKFLEKEIKIFEKLVKQRQISIRNNNPNVIDEWLEDYKETLKKLKNELKELKKQEREEMVMSYISNCDSSIDKELEESEKKISNLFYFDDWSDLYTLDKVILYTGINSRNKDVKINLVYENDEEELLTEDAFYRFIELTPKFIFEEVRQIVIIDLDKKLTHYLYKMDPYRAEGRYRELWRINVERSK